MSTISGRPARVAIVGSGPSGFYAADALIKADRELTIDMFDRLPTPFGLVRGGVAPDHPKIKNVIRIYERIAANDEFSFFGNVHVGRDISVGELRAHYDAVLFTCGAETDRTLNIPGIELPGSYTATEFVGWYNGHPDYLGRAFDLSQEVAVVIGQGNVAVDVTRVLAKTVDELKETDIAAHALDALAESRVKEVHMIGRRGAGAGGVHQQGDPGAGRAGRLRPGVQRPRRLRSEPRQSGGAGRSGQHRRGAQLEGAGRVARAATGGQEPAHRRAFFSEPQGAGR